MIEFKALRENLEHDSVSPPEGRGTWGIHSSSVSHKGELRERVLIPQHFPLPGLCLEQVSVSSEKTLGLSADPW
jgi:hypothetical protein